MDLIIAISKAGHDKGQAYVVLKNEGDSFWLINGKTKTMSNPKLKKKKHIQLVYNISAQVLDIYKDEKQLSDLSVKRILKEFNRRIENV